VHILIGGAWGEGPIFEDGDLSFVQSINKVLYFKNLWRAGFSRCPSNCVRDAGADTTCKCAIPDDYINTYGASTIMKQAGLWDELEPHVGDKDEEFQVKVLRAIEDPGIVGDMFSSNAAFDPTFWPLHGQIERVLGLKRAKNSMGLVESFDETWAYGDSSDKYLRGRCDWSEVSSAEDLTLPSCKFSESK
jgi:hypothetical protein